MRSRGAPAFGCILFFQLNLLARPEVVHRWLGLQYPVVAVTLVAAGALAVVLLLAWPAAVDERRSIALLLVALVLAGVAASHVSGVPSWLGTSWLRAGCR
jgi:hypothetical protein